MYRYIYKFLKNFENKNISLVYRIEILNLKNLVLNFHYKMINNNNLSVKILYINENYLLLITSAYENGDSTRSMKKFYLQRRYLS